MSEKKTFEIENEEGEVLEVELPTKWAVCGDCEGEGSVLTEAIREHAYTAEEMREDPDFAEEYMKGGKGIYGVSCPTCGGRTTVLVVDEEACETPQQKENLRLYNEKQETDARYRAEAAAERRAERAMGA